MTKLKNKIQDFFFNIRYITVMFLVGIIVAFWDLTLKYLLDNKQMPGINGIFNIHSTYNYGGAWSIFSNATWLLIVISILFIIGILIFNKFLRTKNYFYAISMGLLISGAICNLYDRITLGYVRDFINLEFISFPVFNIADISICIGVFLLAIYFIFIMPKIEKKVSKEKCSISDEFVQKDNSEKESNVVTDEVVTENIECKNSTVAENIAESDY